jgi:hypothetical protein
VLNSVEGLSQDGFKNSLTQIDAWKTSSKRGSRRGFDLHIDVN